MRQPDGYSDGSSRVCHLIRTLYGLKQSGREWNEQFNNRMTAKGYKRLRANPCIYICSEGERVVIVTVWVDDILLFTDSAETMDQIKNNIRTEWETTDMGEPNKIVGIGITQFPGEISISQKQSIQNILQRQGLADTSPVQMPLDPNV
jgi:hypothetical protein